MAHHEGKHKHDNAHEALRAASKLNAKDGAAMIGYPCDQCNGWHVGHLDEAGGLRVELGYTAGEKLREIKKELSEG
jgi:hypothetical protein